MFFVVSFRLRHFVRIEWCPGHVVEDRAGAIKRGKIIRIGLENRLELLHGLLAVADILRRRRAGNVLAGVGGCQIELCAGKRGIESLRFLEVFDRLVELPASVRVHALVELVTRTKLRAAAREERHTTNSENKKKPVLFPPHPRSPSKRKLWLTSRAA